MRSTHRWTHTLQQYFPQVLQWFPTKETRVFGDLLRPWPTLKAAHLARRRTLEQCLRQHHLRDEPRLNERREALKRARSLTTDAGGLIPPTLPGAIAR
jgi:hypothetical protein